MAPIAITPPDTAPQSRSDSPTLDSTSKLTKAGIKHQHQHHPETQTPATPAELFASNLTISLTPSPRHVPLPNAPEVLSQQYHTDHMLTVPWNDVSGWGTAQIKPFENLSISPIASVLHYATECFEGMKAYRGTDGKVRLFRPDRNARRFVRSAERIALPVFAPEEFQSLVEAYVGVEAPRWLPKVEKEGGGFQERMLYLRPSMIATHAALGVQRPREALMFIVAVCFPDLDKNIAPTPAPSAGLSVGGIGREKQASGPGVSGRGMKLLASAHDMIRAWPGGFGNAKVGANYGPSLVAQGEARARGYQQILWLFGEQDYVTEAGGSNFFVVWKNEDGQREIVTAPLGDGVILEGVTRASILDLCQERLAVEGIKIVERKFAMDEVVKASEEGRLEEGFACGTAFFVSPVEEIHFRGKDVILPIEEDPGKEKWESVTFRVKGWLEDIMYGREQNEWGVVVDEIEQ